MHGAGAIMGGLQRTIAMGVGTLLSVVLGSCGLAPAPAASPSMTSTASPRHDAATPATEAAVAQLDWAYEGTPGKLLVTPNYRIHTTVTRDAILERLPRLMEAGLAHYRSAIADLPEPAEPLESFVFATRPQWERMTQRVMGADAGVYLQIDRGGFTARGKSVLFDIGLRDTLAIAAHEGWHQYSQTAFREQLPTAFEEGLATYMEGFRLKGDNRDTFAFLPWANPERYFTLRGAAQHNRLMSLEKLVRSTPQELMEGPGPGGFGDRRESDALVYYAQVWALIHFMHDGDNGAYRAGLSQLVTDASEGKVNSRVRDRLGSRAAASFRAGRRTSDLLEVYTGVTAENLEPSYRAFIERITRVGAGEKVMRGESPLEDAAK